MRPIQLCQGPLKRTHNSKRHKEDVTNNTGCTLLDCQNSPELFSSESQVRALRTTRKPIFATNWATPLRNRSNYLCGTFEGKGGSIWRAKAGKFAFPPFSITQQDFTTKEVGNANLLVLIHAWPVSREQQQHAFSEESTFYAVPFGRPETAPYQRSCDSS